MANYYEETNIKPSRFVDPSSRYYESKVAYYKDNKHLTFNTYKKKEYISGSSDKFMVVNKGQEFRPDLISQKAYGVPDFWWKIMEANNIKDVYDFKAGLNIRIPGGVF